MDEEDFRDLLEDHLLPMFAGITLGPRKPSRPGHGLAAYGNPCTLLVKPELNANFRIPLVRSQPFSSDEHQLVEVFMAEVAELADQADGAYFDAILRAVPVQVIARHLAWDNAKKALANAIQHFESLAAQTY